MSEERGEYAVEVYTEPVGVWEPDWFLRMADECRAIMTEAVFTSRWALVEGYWMVGQRIVTDEHYQKWAKGNQKSLTGLSKNSGIGERDLYRAIQFYERYPDLAKLDKLPDGKVISWNKIVKYYLPEHSGAEAAGEPPELEDVVALKRIFRRWWTDMGDPDYERAYSLVVELAGLIKQRARVK